MTSLKPSRSFLKVLGLLAIFSTTPVILLLYYRAGGLPSSTEMAFQKDLRYAFMTGSDALDLRPLAPWSWARACAVTNGLSAEDLNRVLGFTYTDFDELHWLPRPEYWTLLLVNAPRQLTWGSSTTLTPIRISRKDVADLALPDGVKGVCFDRDQARLVLTRNPQAPIGTSPVTARLTSVVSASSSQP